ncbi:MAG TPA: hypothetical protein VLA89_07080 [Gemmatimonadales bacterium]|nr:hypothetical protein [Gemmatimonadales bacterium]
MEESTLSGTRIRPMVTIKVWRRYNGVTQAVEAHGANAEEAAVEAVKYLDLL